MAGSASAAKLCNVPKDAESELESMRQSLEKILALHSTYYVCTKAQKRGWKECPAPSLIIECGIDDLVAVVL